MKKLINLEEKSGYLIYQLNLLWKREITHAVDEFDLTFTQYLVLMATAWLEQGNSSDECVTQARIAEFLKIDRMLVSRMVNKLKDSQLLLIQNSESNNRSKPIKVSDQGLSILKKAVPKIVEKEVGFYDCLSDEEHIKLNTLLSKVLNSNQPKN